MGKNSKKEEELEGGWYLCTVKDDERALFHQDGKWYYSANEPQDYDLSNKPDSVIKKIS